MSSAELVEQLSQLAAAWEESLEPAATADEIESLAEVVRSRLSVQLPLDYLAFLALMDGAESNGLIVYGSKNASQDDQCSPLNLLEMNIDFQDSVLASLPHTVVLGESSTSLLTYNDQSKEYASRDRIAVDRAEVHTSFNSLLSAELQKVA